VNDSDRGSTNERDAGPAAAPLVVERAFREERGGVFGIAVLASVFARQGVYHSPRVFIDGFTQALWVAAGFSALGVLAALFMPAHKRAEAAHAEAHPASARNAEPAWAATEAEI